MPNPSPKLRPIDNPIADNINRINKELYDTSQEESIDAEAAETRKINSVQVAIVEDIVVNHAEQYESVWIPPRAFKVAGPIQPYIARYVMEGVGPQLRHFHDDTVAGYNLYRQSLKHTNTFLTRVSAIYHVHQRHKHQVKEVERYIGSATTEEWRVHTVADGLQFPKASDRYIKEILTEEERRIGLAAPDGSYEEHWANHTIPNELQDMQTLSVATTPIGMRHRAVPDSVLQWQIDQRLFRPDYTHPRFVRDGVALLAIDNRRYGINTVSLRIDVSALTLRPIPITDFTDRVTLVAGIYIEAPGNVYAFRSSHAHLPGYIRPSMDKQVRVLVKDDDEYPVPTRQLTWMPQHFDVWNYEALRRDSNHTKDFVHILYRPDLVSLSAIPTFFNVYLTFMILIQKRPDSPRKPTELTQSWPEQLPYLDNFEVWPVK